jgi:outer membrane protein TolC
MAVCLLCSFAPPVARAQTGGAEEGLRLSLADALRTALENNLDLVSARKDPGIADQGVEVQKAKFDPLLGASASFDRSNFDETFSSPTERVSDTSHTVNPTLGVSFGQLLKFGGHYDLKFTALRTDPSQALNYDERTGFFSFGDALYDQRGLGLTYEMPLLRGFGKEVNTVNLLLAKSNVGITDQQLRQQAESTLKAVEGAYWDLLAANEALRVARETLKLAQDLLDLNKKKVEVGTLAPIEITQAEAGVASREEGVIVAETLVRDAEDYLRRLLGIPAQNPAWSTGITVADRPQYQDVAVDVDAAIATALDKRPEMINARQVLKDRELAERVAHNGVKHDLTLNAGVTPSRSSFDSDIKILNPPGIPGTIATTDTSQLDWTIGLTYGYPIFNRAAKANYAIATLNREKSQVELDNLTQSIRVEVRTAARSVESGVKRVAAARSSKVLQRKTLEAEQKKYENGMSTSFEVLRIQTDLSNAQLSEIRAVLDYVKSLAELERAKGTLIEARGFQISQVRGSAAQPKGK